MPPLLGWKGLNAPSKLFNVSNKYLWRCPRINGKQLILHSAGPSLLNSFTSSVFKTKQTDLKVSA